MRRWMSSCAGLALALWMAGAQAHAHLRGSVPANDSVSRTAPASAVLDFSEPARLTAAWIRKSGGQNHKLASLPSTSSARVSVPLPPLMPGRYELSWRALSADGHIVPGHIRFTVSRPGAPAKR
ncbi:MAG: copper resistance CopC family protein [Steroidobacteraceae bacterium]